MFISCRFAVKLTARKKYFLDFICRLQNIFALLTGEVAAALTG